MQEFDPINNRLNRRVVCAAIRKDGLTITGARHFDNIMHKMLNYVHPIDMRDAEQGFIDQWGDFMTREEAYKVALINGQFIDSPIHKNALFSEDLY